MSIRIRANRSLAFAVLSAMAVLASVPLQAQAANNGAPIYSTDISLVGNLKNLTGKRVTLYLRSGASLTGTVKAIGKRLVHLEKLEGREYFDALVSIRDIAAIDSRAHTPGR